MYGLIDCMSRTCISEFLEYFFSYFQVLQKRQEKDLLQVTFYPGTTGTEFNELLEIAEPYTAGSILNNLLNR